MSKFLEKYPEYLETKQLDEVRSIDFARLDHDGHIYLDYTGSSLYATSQIEKHFNLLNSNLFGNPHSSNPSSSAMTEYIQKTKRHLHQYFNASEDEYQIIFTPNTTGALRLIAESYPFNPDTQLLFNVDNHNSAIGIREYAKRAGAKITYLLPAISSNSQIKISEQELLSYLSSSPKSYSKGLFVYLAQSNFSGIKYPLEWIQLAQQYGHDVILDAAAFVPTNRLDLSLYQPEFVTLSFYKMFGYPTGVGALMAKKSALEKLRRPWFSGGTIVAVSLKIDHYQLKNSKSRSSSSAFEDGTLNYLSIPAVDIGLSYLQSIGGVELIGKRVTMLTDYLIDSLIDLKHQNGRRLIRIYGEDYRGEESRGATLALNFVDPDGRVTDCRYVQQLANQRGISLRTGCFCNPGSGEIFFDLDDQEIRGCLQDSAKFQKAEDYLDCFTKLQMSGGAIRISLGIVSNIADVEGFINFARSFIR